jgi:hypothetical protein
LKAVGKIKDPPKLFDDLIYIWEGFLALSSSRVNFCSISFSEIESWLNLNSIFNRERRQEVTHLIRIMDEQYLEYFREKYAKS